MQIGSWSARGVAIRGDEAKVDDLALLELRHFGQGFEAQVLAGYWWGRSAGGMAASMDIWESTLRVESLWVGRFKDASSEAQFGVGVETAPSAKWTVVAEGLFQTQGLSDVKNVRSPRSRFMSLSGRFYALPLVLYQIHALWKLNAGFLVNLDNETSYIGLGGFEYSAGDNSTVTLRIKWPFGIPEGEFGDRRFEDLAGRTAGLPSTAFLSLQHHF